MAAQLKSRRPPVSLKNQIQALRVLQDEKPTPEICQALKTLQGLYRVRGKFLNACELDEDTLAEQLIELLDIELPRS